MFEVDFNWILKHLMYCVWGICILYLAKFAIKREREFAKNKLTLLFLLLLTGIQAFVALSFLLGEGINFFILNMTIYFVYVLFEVLILKPIQNENKI